MNKSDVVDPTMMEGLCRRYEAVPVSALKRQGLDTLIKAAESRIEKLRITNDERRIEE